MRRQICIYINIYTHTHFVPHHHDKQILSHYYSVFYWLKSTDDWAQFSASQGGFQISVFFFCLRNITRHSTDKIHRWKFFMQKCIEWCRIIMCYRCKETGWHVLKRDSRKNGKKNPGANKMNACLHRCLQDAVDWDSRWKSVIDHAATFPALALNVWND